MGKKNLFFYLSLGKGSKKVYIVKSNFKFLFSIISFRIK
jgi:hypothetical protein